MLSASDVDSFMEHWQGMAFLECVGWGQFFGVPWPWLGMALLGVCIDDDDF